MNLTQLIGRSLVRIFSQNKESVVGAGFLIDDKHILTCAHVLRQALGTSAEISDHLSSVQVNFPFISLKQQLLAKIVLWHEPSDEDYDDVALLELLSPNPPDAIPAKFADVDDKLSKNITIYGFPQGYPQGLLANGILIGKIANGKIQLEDERQSGYFVEPGFSGSPVWSDKMGKVVGMVVTADRDLSIRTAFMNPTQRLKDFISERFPEINIHITENTIQDEQLEIISKGAKERNQPYQRSVPLTPPHTSQTIREERYLQRLRSQILTDTEKYTPLAGRSKSGLNDADNKISSLVMHQEFVLLSREPEEIRQQVVPFENAVMEIRRLGRVVVLGDPGAGKSSTLWRLARQLVDEAIKNPERPIPLLVSLGKWTDPAQSVETFIAQELGELGQYLDNLLNEKRAFLLLDGLNEVPVSQRSHNRRIREQIVQLQNVKSDLYEELAFLERRTSDTRKEIARIEEGQQKHSLDTLQKRLVSFAQQKSDVNRRFRDVERQITNIQDQISDNPDKDDMLKSFADQHSNVVITCRAQDYTLDLGFDMIEIRPLDSVRIREFVTHYLGIDQGEKLFRQLTVEQASRNHERFKENTYWNKQSKEHDKPSSLLHLARNPYMLFMITLVYSANKGQLPENRGELFRDFVLTLMAREKIIEINKTVRRPLMNAKAEKLIKQIATMAFEMQIERGQSNDDSALTTLPLNRALQFLDENQLREASSASMITADNDVRFTHQLLQEYFAATHMRDEISSGRLNAVKIWDTSRWWERNNWEEAVILLAGLFSNDCTPILDWIGVANPEVTAQCIVRSGAFTPEATLNHLRKRWLERLTDVRKDPQPAARAAIGRALAIARLDSRIGVGLRSDGLPDLTWCKVIGGKAYLGGDDSAFLSHSERIEFIPDFYISKYPITYMQFQAFIDAPDGFQNLVWWDGFHSESVIQQEVRPRGQSMKNGNHPRDSVSWFDAMAFCRWVSMKLGYTVTLPTEDQWEYAARGMHGEKPLQGYEVSMLEQAKGKGNTEEVGLGQTTAVGIFPSEEAACGANDMSGNVWEWTLTEYVGSRTNNFSNRNSRVLKGGAWDYSEDNARTASRIYSPPASRDVDYGFRIVRI